jgi:hypothetical protein
MLVLKEGEQCPFSTVCPYNEQGRCWGANPNRNHKFTCEYVVNGKIIDGGTRLPGDKTGKMKVIVD